jgi:hypothetical protein
MPMNCALVCQEVGGSRFFRNFETYAQKYTASYPRAFIRRDVSTDWCHIIRSLLIFALRLRHFIVDRSKEDMRQ